MSQNYLVPPPSKRIEFRIWTRDDMNNAIKLWGSERVTALIGGPFSEEKISKRFALELDELTKSGLQYWAMYYRPTGDFIGCCGIHSIYSTMPGEVEMGAHLLENFWGKGIAPEATTAVLDHTFNTLKITKIISLHHPKNLASKSVITKHLKMTPMGTVLYPPTGLMHPVYYLTNTDYNNNKNIDPLLTPSTVRSKL